MKTSGFGIWSEFLPYEYVHGYLPFLKAYHAELYLGIPVHLQGSDSLARLLEVGQNLHVPIHPWLLLADEDGYWPNALNVERMVEQVYDFMDWLAAKSLSCSWVVIDMEPPLEQSDMINQMFQNKQPWGLRQYLKQGLKDEQFSHAITHYNHLIDYLHSQQIQVMVVSFPMVLDDKNSKLQQVLHTPISAIQWDKVSLLLYRTILSHLSRLPLSPGLITSYLEDARRQFSCSIAADLGVIGSVEKIASGQGYIRLDPLKQDIAATRATGTLDFHLFSLDGMHEISPIQDWLLSPEKAGYYYQANWADRLFRKTIQSAIRFL